MTKQDQLPPYFEKMLMVQQEKMTEEFRAGIRDVRNDIKGIKDDVADLKKKVASSNGRISKLWMALLVISMVLLFHFGESSSNILKIFKFL
jgi:hypothetical protein